MKFLEEVALIPEKKLDLIIFAWIPQILFLPWIIVSLKISRWSYLSFCFSQKKKLSFWYEIHIALV